MPVSLEISHQRNWMVLKSRMEPYLSRITSFLCLLAYRCLILHSFFSGFGLCYGGASSLRRNA